MTEPTPDFDQDAEGLAELLATCWSALHRRLVEKGFSRIEAMSLLRMHVLGTSLNLTGDDDDD